ncbi:glycosyltransferase [Dechloromonas agitata]|uniref:glycosyltransferase n=1 Tax=Dechloromonas agitata TaxID=73030 RepID=UPI00237E17BD|nr:glycosyltransferase [Dechloromonas agitata]MDE1546527.1 glycosyltransferase [Dechloromonas agitata]
MIHFLSPLPPKQTGTADYLMQLLVDLEDDLGPDIRRHIKLWDQFEHMKDRDCLREQGWLADDMAEARFTPEDFVFHFLASNDFHRWVWATLARRAAANVISVVHDLTAFPMIRSMARDPSSGLTRQDELLALRYEFGMQSDWMADHFDDLTPTARYFLMGQGITLARSKTVIVHSEYARMRLLTESVSGLPMPNFKVLAHPRPRFMPFIAMPPDAPGKDIFCVGSIGFYSSIKRNESLLEAFGAFAHTLNADDRCRVRLVFVGKIEDHLRLEAERILNRWAIQDLVSFTGYVDEEALQAWQKRIDLQMNLRFPSCGETSGTLARALVLGKRVVCSRFAAFHEENATWTVSVDPIEEFPELLHILTTEFSRWKGSDNSGTKPALQPTPKAQFSEFIASLIARKNEFKKLHQNPLAKVEVSPGF